MSEGFKRAVSLLSDHVVRLRSADVTVSDVVLNDTTMCAHLRVEHRGLTGDLLVWDSGYMSRVILDANGSFVFEHDAQCSLPAQDLIEEFFERLVPRGTLTEPWP